MHKATKGKSFKNQKTVFSFFFNISSNSFNTSISFQLLTEMLFFSPSSKDIWTAENAIMLVERQISKPDFSSKNRVTFEFEIRPTSFRKKEQLTSLSNYDFFFLFLPNYSLGLMADAVPCIICGFDFFLFLDVCLLCDVNMKQNIVLTMGCLASQYILEI